MMNKYLVEFLGTLFFLFVIIAIGNPLAIGAALAIAIILGGLKVKFAQEIVLCTSLLLIAILMYFLTKTLSKKEKYSIVGTAFIIFIYRAMPTPGPGINWFEIDVLKFDQAFLASLSLTAALLTLVGMLLFKNTI